MKDMYFQCFEDCSIKEFIEWETDTEICYWYFYDKVKQYDLFFIFSCLLLLFNDCTAVDEYFRLSCLVFWCFNS